MATNNELWRRFVDAYEVEVPEEAVLNELNYLKLQLRHNMQYDRLSGGDLHLFPGQELDEQMDELQAVAMFEAKEPRVLKAIIRDQGITATREELEVEAEAMAKRQGTTVEAIKQFFGEDLGMLERDVLEAKAREWALFHLQARE
ncbi:MAG: hypothetical protein IJ131_03215 [Eggerthellaceae bacterium]|nr:hypothetical protein [Eggerthellaceae bacterium]